MFQLRSKLFPLLRYCMKSIEYFSVLQVNFLTLVIFYESWLFYLRRKSALQLARCTTVGTAYFDTFQVNISKDIEWPSVLIPFIFFALIIYDISDSFSVWNSSNRLRWGVAVSGEDGLGPYSPSRRSLFLPSAIPPGYIRPFWGYDLFLSVWGVIILHFS